MCSPMNWEVEISLQSTCEVLELVFSQFSLAFHE